MDKSVTNAIVLNQELERFMAGHMRRKALIQRLVKARIWKDD